MKTREFGTVKGWAPETVMSGMNGDCMTMVDTMTTADASAQAPTWPPTSRSRFEGCVWYEQFMAQSSSASGDAERFMKGLEA